MATEGKTNKNKDRTSDDVSIQPGANSHPGASRKQQNRYSGSYTDGQSSRQHQDRQTPQNMSKKQRQQQHYQTPNTNERWDIPHGRHGSLATDLFGAEGGSPHQFNFQINDPYSAGYQNSDHGYKNGPRNGPRNNNSYGRQNYGGSGKNNRQNRSFPSNTGQSSRHQNGHGGAQTTGVKQNSPPNSQNIDAEPKTHDSAQNTTESQRKVKFIETLMKNGQKSENLTVTVTSNDDRKGKEKSGPGPRSKKETTPIDEKSMAKSKQSSPACKFINPLMSPEPADDTKVKKGLLGDYPGDQQPSSEKKVNTGLQGDHPNNKSYLSDAIAPAPSAKPVVSPEGEEIEKSDRKKKKPRQRERRKKREKEKKDNQNQGATNNRRASQTSNASSSDVNAKPETSGTSSPTKEVSGSDSVSKSGNKKPENEAEKSAVNSLEEKKNEMGNEAKKPVKQSTNEQNAINKKLEEMGLEQAEKRLEKDMIYKLEKSSPTFPDAKYFCKLCSHHLDSIVLAHKHIKDKRHKKETKAWKQDELLRQLKTPPAAALAVLDRQLVSVVEKDMLSQDDVKERKKVVEKLNGVVKQGLPGCSVVAYGSSVTGIGLKSSDVNVDIKYTGDMKTPNVLLELFRILQESDDFVEVCNDFDAKVPQIEVTDKLTHIRCVMSTNNSSVILTTRLMKMYCEIEPALRPLASLLRLWGQLCEVDSQEDGSLPPRSFILMTIFFLQQKHGLPVLHEVMGEHDIDTLISDDGFDKKILEQKSGDWWYNPTAPPPIKKEEKKVEETEEDVDETVEFSDFDLEDIEIIFEDESPKESTAPTTPQDTTDRNSLSPVKIGKCFGENEKPTLATLWLGLLKFYSAQFDMENLIITIKATKKVTRSDRGWPHKRIAVEDPCSPKWNLCKPMSSQTLFTYFLTRLKHSVFYFHTAHNSAKPKNKKKITEKEKKQPHEIKIFGKTPTELSDAIIESVYEEVIPGHKSRLSVKQVNQGHDDVGGTEGHESQLDVPKPAEHEADVRGQPSTSNSDVTKQVSSIADDMVDNMLENLKVMNLDENQGKDKKSEFNYTTCYKFTKASLMDGKTPVLICNSCKKEGHRKKDCPDEEKIEFYPLPPMTDRLHYMLDRVCKEMFDMYVPLEDEVQMRNKVCHDLLKFLQENYSNNTRMCLFGSSRNRFTFRGSDLDICMTFDGNETGEHLDFTNIIEDLAKTLRKNPDLRSIIPITTAKVPIVKFFHPKTRLEGDISLYNLLAQRNTSMLALYASIDERCRHLGYAMKAFVKRCCIGDASRGSLSSYAYTLLVIYFLQQRDPPVLPVLQELYTEEKSPEHIVDGWNSWFYDSIGNLANIWPEFGKNKESLGDLWLGMLIFYTEVFDFRRHVASIRQKKLLTAFEKEWTSKCICIEDPFDLSHNLGAGVSRKMTNFIMRVFIKARERFGTDPGNQLNGAREYSHYFFNAEVLMDGQEVPNDRCCKICGKIGHFVKDCPKRRNGRGKKNDETKMREVQCFSCGVKGHFKKDCPKQVYGSPRKDGQFHPGQVLIPPAPMHGPQHIVIQPLMMQRPVVVRAKRQDSVNMNFQDPRNGPTRQNSNPGGRTPQKAPEGPQKTPDSTQKRQNQERKSELPQKQVKAQQNRHKRQQSDEVTTPQNKAHSKSPHPSSGPISQPRSTPGKGKTPKQVNRSLSSDFDNTKAADSKKITKPSSTLTPESRRGLTLRDTDQKKPKISPESPSPSAIPTVAEIESKMLEQANESTKNKPRAGDNLNHLIPRQTSNEDSRRSVNSGQQAHSGYSRSPPYPPFSPMSPPSPYMFPYHPTSPRSEGNPFNFAQKPGRGAPNQQMARTPPTQGGYNRPPMGQNPHGPQIGQNSYGPQIGPNPHGPLMGQSPPGPQMGQRPHGPQMGQRPHGPHMGQNPQGPQMGQSPHGSQMGQKSHGPQMGQSPHGSQIGQNQHGPQIGQSPQMSQSPHDRGHYFAGVSPPGAGYGYSQSGSRRGHNQGQRAGNSDHPAGHITGVTFVNSNRRNNQHSPRDVRYMDPNSAPPHPSANLHHSYPPNSQYWGTPSPRK